MDTAPLILIAEDEKLFQTLLVQVLRDEGYRTHAVTHGYELLKFLDVQKADLIVLDLKLPDEDGLVLLRQVRARMNVPVLILTATLDESMELACLREGADDYLIKSVSPEALRLRIRNILRRDRHDQPRPRRAAPQDHLLLRGYRVDFLKQTVIDPNGAPLDLTPYEFRTLRLLINARGRILSRGQILDGLSTGPDGPHERMIDGFISRIRKKIPVPELILTIKGEGYRLELDRDPQDQTDAAKPIMEHGDVEFVWSPERGALTVRGRPAVVFPLHSSLSPVVETLETALGPELFRLELMRATSLGATREFAEMIRTVPATFEDAFAKWSTAVAALGWGALTLLHFDPGQRFARVRAVNPWELSLQSSRSVRVGCPFLGGRLRGIFSDVFGTPCGTMETAISYEPSNLFVDFDISETAVDLDTEIREAEAARMAHLERGIADSVASDRAKVTELETALSTSRAESDEMRMFNLGIREEAGAVRAQLAALLQHLPIGSYIKDQDGRYLSINPVFEAFFDVKQADVVGLVPYDVQPVQHARDAREHDLKVLRTGVASDIRHTFERTDGSRTYLFRKFPIRKDDKIIGLVAFITEEP